MSEMDPCQLPDDISYEEWVSFIFDHPVLDPKWFWQEPETGFYQDWDERADPARTLSYITRLFEEPEELQGRFTRGQIDQGLNYLIYCSDHILVLRDQELPWEARERCLLAMIPLYEKLLAPVYGNDSSCSSPANADPNRPNFSCYMWWDIIPLHGNMPHPDGERINEVVLRIFEHVLSMKEEACLESVLHGLGEWHCSLPHRTEPLVRKFLMRSDISPELRAYAERAAIGHVQ